MLEIGSLVDGKYKVLRVVGKGGMSVVYQAVNEKANKIWAIKEVRKDGVQNFEVVKQNLIVETELLKRFNHPNLPSIIDVIDTDDAFLIVMDYIEGNSLSKALEESGAQDQEDVVEWAKQLCDVLGYLHSRKPPIIYRDMKPANVMLKPDGQVSLIDFGTAREFKSTSVEDTTCLGTQGYAAPEQYGGHGQTDARTDIYCLGATMYHLVTGHNPSMPPYEMYPIRQWNPQLSSGLEQIIIKCTQRNPADRYQSCAELLYDLEHYRDLDIENQKSQDKKWKIFLTCAIITLVAALGAVGCKIGEGMAKSSTYDSLIGEAQQAAGRASGNDDGTVRYKDAVDIYERAIELEPGNTQAYLEVLALYSGNNVLSDQEYVDIDQKITEHEAAIIAKDKSAYMELARELADDAFFSIDTVSETTQYVDETKGYLYASKWYGKALDASNDPDSEHALQNRKTIVDSYIDRENYGGVDTHGEIIGTSPAELFQSLKEVVENDEIESDNFVIKLRSYKIITYLLFIRNNDFLKKDQVSLEDYNALVDDIESKVGEIVKSDAFQSSVGASGYLTTLSEGITQDIENIRNLSGGNTDASK